jgi:hypothetical protein
MTRTQALLLTATTVLLVAWWATGAGEWSASPRPGVVAAPRVVVTPVAVDALASRAAALRAYLASPRPPGQVRRNPFVFGTSPPRARVPSPVMLAPHAARPEMRLSGIAEDSGEAGLVRTAVISVLGQVFLAKEGDRVLSRFLVVRVASDAVQLRDADGDEAFTLVLR